MDINSILINNLDKSNIDILKTFLKNNLIFFPNLNSKTKFISDNQILLFFLKVQDEIKIKSIETKNNKSTIANEILKAYLELRQNNISLRELPQVEFNSQEQKSDMLLAISKYELFKKNNNIIDIFDIKEQIITIKKDNNEIKKQLEQLINSDKTKEQHDNSNEHKQIKKIKTKNQTSTFHFILDKIKSNEQEKSTILFTKKNDKENFADFLDYFNINYQIKNYNIFSREEIKDIIKILKIVSSPKTSNIELFWLMKKSYISELTLKKISRSASLKEKSIYKYILKNLPQDIEEREIIIKIISKINTIHENLHKNNFNLKKTCFDISKEFYYLINKEKSEIKKLSIDKLIEFTEEYTIINYVNTIENFIKDSDIFTQLNLEFNLFSNKKNKILLDDLFSNIKPSNIDNLFVPFFNKSAIPQYSNNRLYVTEFTINKDNFVSKQQEQFLNNCKNSKNIYLISNHKNELSTIPQEPSKFEIFFPGEWSEGPNKNTSSQTSKEKIKNELISRLIEHLNNNDFEKAKKELEILSNLNSAVKQNTLNSFIDNDISNKINYYKNKIKEENHIDFDTSKMVYSVSQLQTYDNCPKKYAYNYIFKIPSLPKPYFDFGTAMHAVAEDLIPEIEKKIHSKEIIYTKAVKLLTKNWISNGYENETQEKEYFEKAINSLKKFIDREYELTKENRKTTFREKKFNIEIEGKKITGIIDRIDETEKGLEILDYKTSNSCETEHSLKNNIQLGIYSIALKQMLRSNISSIGLWYLIHDKIIKISHEKLNEEQIRNKAIQLIKNIEKKDFTPKPSNFACTYCDFTNICESSCKK